MGFGDIGEALLDLAFGGKGESGLQQTQRVMSQSESARTYRDVNIPQGRFDAGAAENPILTKMLQGALDVSGHVPNARNMSAKQFSIALGAAGINLTGISPVGTTSKRTKASLIERPSQKSIG